MCASIVNRYFDEELTKSLIGDGVFLYRGNDYKTFITVSKAITTEILPSSGISVRMVNPVLILKHIYWRYNLIRLIQMRFNVFSQ